MRKAQSIGKMIKVPLKKEFKFCHTQWEGIHSFVNNLLSKGYYIQNRTLYGGVNRVEYSEFLARIFNHSNKDKLLKLISRPGTLIFEVIEKGRGLPSALLVLVLKKKSAHNVLFWCEDENDPNCFKYGLVYDALNFLKQLGIKNLYFNSKENLDPKEMNKWKKKWSLHK